MCSIYEPVSARLLASDVALRNNQRDGQMDR